MRFEGYKISGYDATYRKALFNVVEKGNKNRVLEVTDLESGTTFLIDFDSGSVPNRRTSGWHKDEAKGQGTNIAFGSKGIFEQLMYEGKKRKISKDGGTE